MDPNEGRQHPDYSDEDLAQLTDAEREGLLSDDDDDGGEGGEGDEGAAEEAVEGANGGEAVEEEEDAEGEEDSQGEDEGDEGEGGAPAEPPAPAPAPEPEAGKDEVAAPHRSRTHIVAPPEGAETRLQEIETELAKLDQEFDDADIMTSEYRQKSRALENERRNIERQIDRAEISRDNAVAAWNDDVETFLASHPAYEKGSALYHALDAEVRRLQGTEGANPFDPAHLTKAHEAITAQVAALTGAKPAPKKDPKPTRERVDPPPTLGGMPGADDTSLDGGGEFAYLDRLDGEAFERELAKLPESKQQEYLQRG